MTRQVKTRSVSLASVARNPAFRDGVSDYTKGKSPDYDRVYPYKRDKTPTDSIWAYERGRMFAAWAQGEGREIPAPWFIDRRLSWAVQDAVSDAVRCGAIR